MDINYQSKRVVVFCFCALVLMVGCVEATLPTIGRTIGDYPMTRLLHKQQNCYQVKVPIYFEAPFATGMSFHPAECILSGRKIGRKTVEEVASMAVTITYDGEFYIIKHGR